MRKGYIPCHHHHHLTHITALLSSFACRKKNPPHNVLYNAYHTLFFSSHYSFHFDCLFRSSCSRPAFCRLGYIRHRAKRFPLQTEEYVGIVKLCKLSRRRSWNFTKKNKKKARITPTPDPPSGDCLTRSFTRIEYAIFPLNGVHHLVLNTDNPKLSSRWI